jgi:hypothetical protein
MGTGVRIGILRLELQLAQSAQRCALDKGVEIDADLKSALKRN